MANIRDPILTPVSIADLRPTQITVGLREVEEKRKCLRDRPQKKIGKFLGDHMIPVIRGPKDLNYDHRSSSSRACLAWRRRRACPCRDSG